MSGKVGQGILCLHWMQKEKMIQTCYCYDLSGNSEDIHPARFCNACYLTMIRIESSKAEQNVYRTSLNLATWLPHHEICSVCSINSGGRPKKRKRITGCFQDHCRVVAGPKYKSCTPLTVDKHLADSQFLILSASFVAILLTNLQSYRARKLCVMNAVWTSCVVTPLPCHVLHVQMAIQLQCPPSRHHHPSP